MTLVSPYDYHKPYGYRMTITSRDETTPYYVFDSLDQNDGVSQPVNIYNHVLNLNTQVSQSTFTIEDGQKTVDRDMIKAGAQIKIQVSKDPAWFANDDSYCFVGYIDYPSPDQPATNVNLLQVIAKEVKQQFYQTQIDFHRSAPLSVLNDPFSAKSLDYTIKQQLRKMVEKKENTVLNDISVVDRFNLLTGGLSSNLDAVLPNVTYKSSVGSAYDDLANKLGFIWGFDYKGGLKKLYADYIHTMRAPVVIKTGPANLLANADDPNRTSYLISGLSTPSTSDASAFHASRLFGVTKIAGKTIAGSDIQIATTSTTNKAIYQPFTTNEVRFTGLDIVMSKLGAPASRKNVLRGAVYTNKVVEGVNQPKELLQNWEVPLDDIKESETNVHIPLDDLRTRFTEGNTDYGYVVFQRSGISEKSDPNNDELNTVLLLRDNNSNGGSSVAKGGDFHNPTELEWKKDGPTYAFAVTSSIQRVYSVTNYSHADDVGLIEPDPIDLSIIDDVNLSAKYLTQLLFVMSQYKAEPRITASLPDYFIFKPWQTTKLMTNLAFPSGLDFELHDITYDFTQNDNIVALGGLVFIDNKWPVSWPCSTVL